MSKCVICGEDDRDLLIKHHTIPIEINPLWEKRIFLCERCHKKVHKYVIKDLVRLLSGIKNSYNDMGILLSSRGFYIKEDEEAPSIAEISKVFRVLISLLPKNKNSDDNRRIPIDVIADACNLSNQRVGYILRDMEVEKGRSRTGMYLCFTKANINKITKLSAKLFPKIDLSEPIKPISRIERVLNKYLEDGHTQTTLSL